MFYETDADPRGPGYGATQQQVLSTLGAYLIAIDYKTGKVVWRHRYPPAGDGYGGPPGILTTAGHLLFTGDGGGGNFIAFDPTTGNPLWHTHIGPVSNAAQTYMLDGHQYVLVAVDDMLYAFTLD